jgi:hypothetical protein
MEYKFIVSVEAESQEQAWAHMEDIFQVCQPYGLVDWS